MNWTQPESFVNDNPYKTLNLMPWAISLLASQRDVVGGGKGRFKAITVIELDE